ncbi:MAG: hypothetical protein KA223_01125 [Candidatus Accumulibacter sp.]|jgi:hypothetical protein|nr:hypothetical protein [Accumulibacter sp.]
MSTVLHKAPSTMKIGDLNTGLQILADLPLGDAERAELELNRFFDSLLQSPPESEIYLQLLEQTRIALCFIEEERARCYTNKALPLGEFEERAFRRVVDTWLKAARAYAHCAQLKSPGGSTAHAERLALILHRCIYYSGMAISEHYRARQHLSSGLWLNLHGYYASAEEWGVARLPVGDSLDAQGRNTQCTTAYVSLLLIELAGPYGLSVEEAGLVRRWANSWAPLVSLHATAADEPLAPLLVDLMHDAGVRAACDCRQAAQLRRLDSSRLALQLRQARKLLQERVSPAQIGLGEDCTDEQCRLLLNRLFKRWGLLHTGRKFRRHTASGTSRVCSGFTGMHFHVSGKEFSQPESERVYSRQDFDTLFAFRHMLEPAQMLEVRQVQLGLGLDIWEVLDQSASGFRLLRAGAGRKIEPRQLVSICPHDGKSHLLAQVAWLMQEQGGCLLAGIAALPGKPQAVAVRPLTQEAGQSGPYSRAFLLPAMEAMAAEPTLVIPRGWYQTGRLLEVYSESLRRVRLQRLASEGADFERVTFVEL